MQSHRKFVSKRVRLLKDCHTRLGLEEFVVIVFFSFYVLCGILYYLCPKENKKFTSLKKLLSWMYTNSKFGLLLLLFWIYFNNLLLFASGITIIKTGVFGVVDFNLLIIRSFGLVYPFLMMKEELDEFQKYIKAMFYSSAFQSALKRIKINKVKVSEVKEVKKEENSPKLKIEEIFNFKVKKEKLFEESKNDKVHRMKKLIDLQNKSIGFNRMTDLQKMKKVRKLENTMRNKHTRHPIIFKTVKSKFDRDIHRINDIKR